MEKRAVYYIPVFICDEQLFNCSYQREHDSPDSLCDGFFCYSFNGLYIEIQNSKMLWIWSAVYDWLNHCSIPFLSCFGVWKTRILCLVKWKGIFEPFFLFADLFFILQVEQK